MSLRETDAPGRGPSDPARVFKALTDYEVDFVVIGGWAVIGHTRTRATNDVDFMADPDPANLRRLERALGELDARLHGVDADLLDVKLDAETLGNGANFTLATVAGGVDYFSEVPGGVPYPELRERAVGAVARGMLIRIASVRDLVRMKTAAGRPQDLEDIALLTERRAQDS